MELSFPIITNVFNNKLYYEHSRQSDEDFVYFMFSQGIVNFASYLIYRILFFQVLSMACREMHF